MEKVRSIMPNVTVIVATYNSSVEKTIATISSIIQQKNIALELLISDDGSKDNYIDSISKYIKEQHFGNCFIVRHEKNVGTVQNVLDAMCQATGDYVYTISPGDMLYDDYVLHDMYSFAKENDSKIVFGDGVYYSRELSGDIKIHKIENRPSKPWVFSPIMSISFQKIAFMNGMKILGAAFLRERTAAIKAFIKISEKCKYVEDSTTSLVFAFSGNKTHHINRKVVFYEFNTGISTSKNTTWKKIINDEIVAIRQEIEEENKRDKIIDYFRYKQCVGIKKYICVLRHPFVLILHMIILFSPRRFTDSTISEERLARLRHYVL